MLPVSNAVRSMLPRLPLLTAAYHLLPILEIALGVIMFVMRHMKAFDPDSVSP